MRIRTLSIASGNVTDVNIEVQISPGIPIFTIVGLGNKAILESKERIRSAISSVGIQFPAKRVIVNLSPANEKKEGTHYELGIALAILYYLGKIDKNNHLIENSIVIGELSLNGDILPVESTLVYALTASNRNMKLIFSSKSYNDEIKYIGGHLIPVDNLSNLIGDEHVSGTYYEGSHNSFERESVIDFSNIRGHVGVKRALEIAVAGSHHICMIGSPGSGKSILAKATEFIQPPLTREEILEISVIHSLAGEETDLVKTRPFRSPHHSASTAAIIGGGTKFKPGEVSLSHRGIMFMDEFLEFPKPTLEALREPLESYCIEVSRANYKQKYPAMFQLIAAMNPCSCGNCEDISCSIRYQKKLSQPLKERFDFFIYVNEFNYIDSNKIEESSLSIRNRIISARDKQIKRQNKLNAHLNVTDIAKIIEIDKEAEIKLGLYCKKRELSTRVEASIIKIARTISDLDGSEIIQENHILEAIGFRRFGGPDGTRTRDLPRDRRTF